MARETTGSCKPRTLADGTRAFDLRFQVNGERESIVLHERQGCSCGCGGGWDEPAARTELGNILARVRVGIWERPQPPVGPVEFGGEEAPTYAAYSEWWMKAKADGVIGDKPISVNTRRDYEWRLAYSQSFFGDTPVDQIDRALCLEFKANLLAEAREQREALDAGADLRDHRGRSVVPLGPASIKKILDSFAAVLDEAVEDDLREDNPARGRRMRVKVPKPRRTFLEMDELAALLDAAGDQDAVMLVSAPADAGKTATAVASLASKGLSASQIAQGIGRSKPAVTYHLRRLGADIGRGYVGRRAVCELLGRAGPRVGELTAMKIGQVRVHAPDGARFRIPDSKTEAGVRVVEMSPALVEVVVAHIDRLRRLGLPTGPDDFLLPNLRGGPMTRQRVGQIIHDAAQLAGERLAEKGVAPLPNTTAHTLRRTYISIALIANEFDVKFVMAQVGHADSKMTMDVYAQLEKRAKRSHGESFDRLVSEARDQVKALPLARGARARTPASS
jgi:integrase